MREFQNRWCERGNMTERFLLKPNGRSWWASFAWIPRSLKAETQQRSHVLAFTHSLGSWATKLRNALRLTHGTLYELVQSGNVMDRTVTCSKIRRFFRAGFEIETKTAVVGNFA